MFRYLLPAVHNSVVEYNYEVEDNDEQVNYNNDEISLVFSHD